MRRWPCREAAIGNSLPDIRLTDPEGRAIELSSLNDGPVLVAMIYTGCISVCPTILESLKPAVETAQETLGASSFTVVTIGFDSRNDTPDRMRSFARERGIDLPNWLFLAGSDRSITKLADATGFSIVPSAGGFDHMAQVSIFDADGKLYQQVRGSIFPTPAIVEPLKDLMFGRRGSGLSIEGITERIKLFCTVYNPNTGRYYFNYSLFIGIAIGIACLLLVSRLADPGIQDVRQPGRRNPSMTFIRAVLRRCFDTAEAGLGMAFPAAWNPLLNLGALGFMFYWIITVSGIYVYIFFDTGVHNAYESIEYMTHEQWYLAGIMRSLHRYASDALIVVMLLHLVREFSRDRYRGVRWFSWLTGIPVLIMVYFAGISGYWLVWDKLAQYVAIVSTEWLDKLPIFGEPIARNFLSPDALESRFFTLMIFMHIAIPLIALIILWVHLQRVTKPRINPPRGLALSTFAALIGLSLVHPALSQAPADLAVVPGKVGLDWFYLPLFPLLEKLPGSLTWGMAMCLLVMLIMLPWMPPLRRAAPATVDLANCNGCSRCFNDCPYNAISMVARSDGTAFEREPIVNPAYCVSCGICAGACPTSMPFRRLSDLSPGIDLPEHSIASLREATESAASSLSGSSRIIVFGCDSGPNLNALRSESIGTVKLACIGQLPPAFIDYAISRNLADGVMLTGCSENSCSARYGVEWTKQRVAGERDPHLRNRVPRERLRMCWAGASGTGKLKQALDEFARELNGLPAPKRSITTPHREPVTVEA